LAIRAGIKTESLNELFQSCVSLTQLNLERATVAQNLTCLTNLEHLRLWCCDNANDSIGPQLRHLTKLQTLIKECSGRMSSKITDSFIPIVIPALKNLQYVCLQASNISSAEHLPYFLRYSYYF
jgi:hypothetical protein